MSHGRQRVLLLDTHALVWIMSDDPSLGRDAKDAIESAFAETEVAVSAMSFWEVMMLARRGRIMIHEEPSSWREKVLALGIIEIPVTGDIAIEAGRLSELPGDPGDRLIAATALIRGTALVTADRRLLEWRSPLRRIDARR